MRMVDVACNKGYMKEWWNNGRLNGVYIIFKYCNGEVGNKRKKK